MEDEINKIWEEFWVPILYPDNQFDIEQLKKELADYYKTINSTTYIYNQITKGIASNHTTSVIDIMNIHDKLWEEKNATGDMLGDSEVLQSDGSDHQEMA